MGLYNLCYDKTKACSSPRCAHSCCLMNMMEILNFCQEIFDMKNIPFFITYNTLYSFIKLKTISIDQDNIQIMTLSSFTDAIEDLRPNFEKMGYVLKKNCVLNSNLIEHNNFTIFYSDHNNNNIELFLLTEENNYLIDYTNNIIYTRNTIFPLHNALLFNNKISIPANCNDFIKIYLKNKFGDSFIPEILTPASLLETKSLSQTVLDNNYDIYCCYVINNYKRRDRLHNTIMECNKYNLCIKRIEAVMGATLDKNKLIKDNLYDPINKLKLNEIGTSLSHINCWKEISKLDDNNVWCLVLEDDVVFCDNFDKIMKQAKMTINSIDCDIVFLGCQVLNPKLIKNISKNICITGPTLGLWSYLLRPKTAKKILLNIFPIKYPIDCVVNVSHPFFNSHHEYHDTKYAGKLKNICIGSKIIANYNFPRIGIINETSTITKSSTSSTSCQNDFKEPSINYEKIVIGKSMLVDAINMLRFIDIYLTKNNITYYLIGGTLLGAVRHHNIIPWDADCNISVLKNNEKNFLSMGAWLNEQGYRLVRFQFGYKIYHLNTNFPYINVYIMEESNDKYVFSSIELQKKFAIHNIFKSELFPLIRHKFSDFYLPIPHKSLDILYRIYGYDWRTRALKWYDTICDKPIEKISFYIPHNIRKI